MIFTYSRINPEISRPIIPLVIKSKTIFILYSGIIDSGADHCVFSLEIAHKLGLRLPQESKVGLIGVGKDQVRGFLVTVELRIGGVQYKSDVIFADISDFGHGILGHKGFFDHFDVNLKYKDQIVEIKENSGN